MTMKTGLKTRRVPAPVIGSVCAKVAAREVAAAPYQGGESPKMMPRKEFAINVGFEIMCYMII
jgi:hypothetical protein